MEFLISHGLEGLAIGFITFIVIGLFHPLVIKGEYYFGVKCWIAFLFLGLIAGTSSVLVDNTYLSIILGVVCFSSFWGILEIFEQRGRVERGWFPMNPRRKHKYNRK